MQKDVDVTGIEGNSNSKDLDVIVSSFLQELEVLSTELETSPTPPQSVPHITQAIPDLVRLQPEFPEKIKNRAAPNYNYKLIFGSIAAIALLLFCWLQFRASLKEISHQRSIPTGNSRQQQPRTKSLLNDTALLLAGMPVESGSPFYALSAAPPLQRHRAEMKAFWRKIQTGTLAAVSQWREANIPARLRNNAILYPMSGGDYLNAYAFFPQASEFLLIALEPPGDAPNLDNLSVKELDESLSAIRHSVQSMASVNYLQSKSMRTDLGAASIRGVAPLLLLFAAGTGHAVLSLHPVTLGREGLVPGNSVESPEKFHRVAGIDIPEGIVRGIQLQLVDKNDIRKTITYLQMELSDRIFTGGGPEGKYLLSMKNRNSILKSAVYLLHGRGYGRVCEFMLGSSNLIIQDDSGIPYRYFHQSGWEQHLFGTYTRARPLGTLTDPPQQPVLAREYQLSSQPLSFFYGYGGVWGENESNLMLFIKK